MKNWIKQIFGSQESPSLVDWETSDSILAYIKGNIDSNGSLPESSQTLPDEKKGENEIKFAAGLADSIFGQDDSNETKVLVKDLVQLISSVARNGDKQSKSDFYLKITEREGVIGIIDQFLEGLVASSVPVEPYLFEFSLKLATKTRNRNAVKFGVAILGLCQNKQAIDDIKVLGIHDEFTVFSTIALSNLSDNLVGDLWHLAKLVDGWGRIRVVDILAQMDLSDKIRDWLVRDGYKNNIMYEYLALTCATNGRLGKKLAKDSIDQGLFDSAGEIIVALMDEGPAQGMSEYKEAEETIQSYVRHAKLVHLKIADFVIIHRIKDYLEQGPAQNDVLKSWSQDVISNVLSDINKVLVSKDWKIEVNSALNSSDNQEYWNGKYAAGKLNMDISGIFWERLKKYPFESSSWYDITTRVQHNNPQKLVDNATSLIPIEEISTGPQDTMGVGPDWQKHQSLEAVITFLGSHPKIGEEIILAGLRSPVIGNRNMTLRTLQSWTSENWSERIKSELLNLKEIEPTEDTRADLISLLKDERIG